MRTRFAALAALIGVTIFAASCAPPAVHALQAKREIEVVEKMLHNGSFDKMIVRISARTPYDMPYFMSMAPMPRAFNEQVAFIISKPAAGVLVVVRFIGPDKKVAYTITLSEGRCRESITEPYARCADQPAGVWLKLYRDFLAYAGSHGGKGYV